MYWSDCSGPTTIQTARIADGGDQQTLISDTQSCIVDIVIDFHSRPTYITHIVNANPKLNHSLDLAI